MNAHDKDFDQAYSIYNHRNVENTKNQENEAYCSQDACYSMKDGESILSTWVGSLFNKKTTMEK